MCGKLSAKQRSLPPRQWEVVRDFFNMKISITEKGLSFNLARLVSIREELEVETVCEAT